MGCGFALRLLASCFSVHVRVNRVVQVVQIIRRFCEICVVRKDSIWTVEEIKETCGEEENERLVEMKETRNWFLHQNRWTIK